MAPKKTWSPQKLDFFSSSKPSLRKKGKSFGRQLKRCMSSEINICFVVSIQELSDRDLTRQGTNLWKLRKYLTTLQTLIPSESGG